ncbi:hypothetical protein Hypma_001111 [Hypsizygus marmoreus]|uniref:Uncharacterized protein n=1 Tax=Hypsizygus marmoreus TaxID=39966 RepID=A0A369J998_HYPMA|nr:hypothetical protein Hypma_001111 [Hypsizygus marmoreus]
MAVNVKGCFLIPTCAEGEEEEGKWCYETSPDTCRVVIFMIACTFEFSGVPRDLQYGTDVGFSNSRPITKFEE